MLILSEKRLRVVIREEFEKFMEVPQTPPDVLSIKSETGAEIIMPSYAKQQFDDGKVHSFADIL